MVPFRRRHIRVRTQAWFRERDWQQACVHERTGIEKKGEREKEREIVTGRERKEHRLCAGAWNTVENGEHGRYVREYRLRISIMGNYRGGNRSWAWYNRTGPRPQHVRSSASTLPSAPLSFAPSYLLPSLRLLSCTPFASRTIGFSDSQFRPVFIHVRQGTCMYKVQEIRR